MRNLPPSFNQGVSFLHRAHLWDVTQLLRDIQNINCEVKYTLRSTSCRWECQRPQTHRNNFHSILGADVRQKRFNLGHHQAFVSPLSVPGPLLLGVKRDFHFRNNRRTRLVTALCASALITLGCRGLCRFRPWRELPLKMGHKVLALYARLFDTFFVKRSHLWDKWLSSDYR